MGSNPTGVAFESVDVALEVKRESLRVFCVDGRVVKALDLGSNPLTWAWVQAPLNASSCMAMFY